MLGQGLVLKACPEGFNPCPNSTYPRSFKENPLNPFNPFTVNPFRMNPLTDPLTYFNRTIRLVCVTSLALS